MIHSRKTRESFTRRQQRVRKDIEAISRTLKVALFEAAILASSFYGIYLLLKAHFAR